MDMVTIASLGVFVFALIAVSIIVSLSWKRVIRTEHAMISSAQSYLDMQIKSALAQAERSNEQFRENFEQQQDNADQRQGNLDQYQDNLDQYQDNLHQQRGNLAQHKDNLDRKDNSI
jgi:hypothetical protein